MSELRNLLSSKEALYSTPKELARKMISKIQGHPIEILEPSAGTGALIAALGGVWDSGQGFGGGYKYCNANIRAIEIDPDLQSILRGKGIKVIDTDFLTYSGPDKWDLIIANPAFDQGELHLLKAIDIMYRGEIIFLLNAETIRNPHTNSRKELASKLKELNAEVEFIEEAFKNAERPTGVEVALVYIRIERRVEDDLFAGADDKMEQVNARVTENYDVSTGRTIAELVSEYNQVVKLGTEAIISYFRSYRKIGKYLTLNEEPQAYHSVDYSAEDLTSKMQKELNDLLCRVRVDFWRRTLNLQEVYKRMTRSKHSEFEHQLKQRSEMDFTENNIRQFVLNLIGSYEQILTDAVLEVFKIFTIEHAFTGGSINNNIHYYNGWKTTKAYRVAKKVVIDVYGPTSFVDEYSGKWKLNYNAREYLRDIDVVMNYFDGMSDYHSITQALENALARGQSKNIESTYFTMNVFKKGSIHFTFNSDDILRRFNIAASRGKNWLPHDYGQKPYYECSEEEKAAIDAFEGAEEYTKNLNQPVFATKRDTLMIAA